MAVLPALWRLRRARRERSEAVGFAWPHLAALTPLWQLHKFCTKAAGEVTKSAPWFANAAASDDLMRHIAPTKHYRLPTSLTTEGWWLIAGAETLLQFGSGTRDVFCEFPLKNESNTHDYCRNRQPVSLAKSEVS